MADPRSDDIELRSTDDFDGIRKLALESGLEDGPFEGIVAAFGLFSGEELVGCAALKQVSDRYSIEWLAVSDRMRNRGLGSRLIRRIEEEARSRGARVLWALARAPGFFQAIGFRLARADETGGPTLVNCANCAQFGKSCNPAIVLRFL